jgi:hypothetical protein
MGTGAIIGIVAGFVFALIGVILLVVAIVSRNKANKAKGWPTAQGMVVSSEVREHQNYDSEDGRSSINYEPVVQYSYTVNGTPYTASRIAYGANQFDHNTAQNKANRYAAGSAVTVHYNPGDPHDVVLETEAGGSKVFMIIGIIFAVVGLMACCVGGIAGFITMAASGQ